MENLFDRTKMLIGNDGIEYLKKCHVAVFGIGGVGSYVVEALIRAGIGQISLFDSDIINITNINRQLIATTKTVGLDKVSVAKTRILEINPSAIVHCHKIFYMQENAEDYPLSKYDFVVDAIDTVSSKLKLIENSVKDNISIISSMGTGNKLDPTKFMVDDIYKTSVCPLAKVMRHELRKRGINKLKVVYSKEEPIKPIENQSLVKEDTNIRKRSTPASISFVPSAAGLIIASQVVNDLLSSKINKD